MNRNPIIPFILIMVMGIGLVFFMSLEGLNNSKEMAEEEKKQEEGGGETAEGGAFDPEAHYQSTCISCHGENYEGGAGPALKGVGERLSDEEIKSTLKNGKGAMPPGLVQDENLDAMAKWLKSL
ncbi:cytochrome c550 [Bacillus pakistanensis]|uniref:Cytochrome c550 n=1 Tax=Rossellomorea pakistanensis TaxID=992288 RepID=A0ABS2NA21_9BACI|nr:cytochrome c [Bacillus pakistanensis]MBM7584707.1 cytochrome c550 [Bacillus pakistanensis]